jgi:hypothetical protein
MKYQYLKIVTPGEVAIMEGNLSLVKDIGWVNKVIFFFYYIVFRKDFPIPIGDGNKKFLTQLLTKHIKMNPWDEKKNEAVKKTIKHIKKNEAKLFIAHKPKDRDKE